MLFHCKVDLISKRALERSRNWLLRQEILSTAETIFQFSNTLPAFRAVYH